MSIEIKFWDKERDEYNKNTHFMVCENGKVWHLYGGMDAQLDQVDHVEPHFYKDGKRIYK